jgi:hypothetical protein
MGIPDDLCAKSNGPTQSGEQGMHGWELTGIGETHLAPTQIARHAVLKAY